MDVLEPWLLSFGDEFEDYSKTDIADAQEDLRLHNKLVLEYLADKRPLDDLLDYTSDLGLNAYDYLNAVKLGVSQLITDSVEADDVDWLASKININSVDN